jgi:hypothetical protein
LFERKREEAGAAAAVVVNPLAEAAAEERVAVSMEATCLRIS